MPKPKTILIVTSGHPCRNPRVVKESTALAEEGYSVTLLTVSYGAANARIDAELLKETHVRHITLDLGSSSFSSRMSGTVQRFLTWTARKAFRYAGIQTNQALGPASALWRSICNISADLTILHTEIPICLAQHLIKKRRSFAVDIEDWHSEDLLPEDRVTRPISLLRTAESIALNNAAYCSTTSECMADALSGTFACPRPVVIHNVFPLQSKSRLDFRDRNGPCSFVWFSQTIGPGRGLESFVAAWNLMKHRTTLTLIGEARPNFVKQLRESIRSEFTSDLQIHPPTTPSMLPELLAEHDIGLALEQNTPVNRDLTLTNKIFQYMNAGLAVIATSTLGQNELMSSVPDIGMVIEPSDINSVARNLDLLVTDQLRLRSMQEASRKAAEQKYCWEIEKNRLNEAVAMALSSNR